MQKSIASTKPLKTAFAGDTGAAKHVLLVAFIKCSPENVR
jgi:hypothetical protein